MRKCIKSAINEATQSRSQLIDKADELYTSAWKEGSGVEVEDIFNKYGASSDDSDPQEGFFSTMTDSQLSNAIREVENLLYGDSEENNITLVLGKKEANALKEILDHYPASSSYERSVISRIINQL